MADEHLSESQLRQMERMTSDTFICDVVGVRLTQFDAGRVTVELTLTDRHLNGVGICQGGVILSIADYALAVASNYTEDPVVSVEISASFCRSVSTGKIIAKAKELVRTRSTSVGEVSVSDEDGNILALVRGRGYVLKSRSKER